MTTAKEEVRRILEQIPGDVTFEDIQYHIFVRIPKGMAEFSHG